MKILVKFFKIKKREESKRKESINSFLLVKTLLTQAGVCDLLSDLEIKPQTESSWKVKKREGKKGKRAEWKQEVSLLLFLWNSLGFGSKTSKPKAFEK